jgi:hypothetical protein
MTLKQGIAEKGHSKKIGILHWAWKESYIIKELIAFVSFIT